jgi:hypothetical protein
MGLRSRRTSRVFLAYPLILLYAHCVKKTTVTRRALVQRINRVLSKKNQALRATNRKQSEYVRVDTVKNTVLESAVDLGKMAEKLNVLKPWETKT